MKKYKRSLIIAVLVILAVAAFILVHEAQPEHKAQYLLEVSGTADESGVIEYAGMEMNVYLDLAHNPCGTCSEQPVSVYVGADEEEVVNAMAKAVKRADDVWIVKKKTATSLLLEERKISSAVKPSEPSAPDGLKIKGTFRKAH